MFDVAVLRPLWGADMVIQISIEQTQPLIGTASDERGVPVPFVGWMALLRAISDLVEASGPCPAEGRPVPVASSERTKGDQDLS